jgi:hypothetical protein
MIETRNVRCLLARSAKTRKVGRLRPGVKTRKVSVRDLKWKSEKSGQILFLLLLSPISPCTDFSGFVLGVRWMNVELRSRYELRDKDD